MNYATLRSVIRFTLILLTALVFSVGILFSRNVLPSDLVAWEDSLIKAKKTDTLQLKQMSAGSSAASSLLPSVIPPSPQSQLFQRYLNHQINESNGLAQINIPLYTIRLKGMEIPVTLSYHSGGVKFRQYDGDLGAGWTLSIAGYRMMRTIHGKPDESSYYMDNPYFDNLHQNGGKVNAERDLYLANICAVGSPPYDKFNTGGAYITDYRLDGEPDLFSYITPSTSGSFIITDRGSFSRTSNSRLIATSLENSLDKITLPASLNIPSLVDDNGFIYNFGSSTNRFGYAETTSGNDNILSNVTTSWALREIVSPYQTGSAVTFSYVRNLPGNGFNNYGVTFKVIDATRTNGLMYEDDNGGEIRLPDYQEAYIHDSDTPLQEMLFLSLLETERERINITRSTNDGVNFNGWTKMVTEIVISDKLSSAVIRKINFEYELYGNHQLLKTVRIQGQHAADGMEVYHLDYYKPEGNNILSTFSYPDEWGYYKTGGSFNYPFHQEFKDGKFVSTPGPYFHYNSSLGRVFDSKFTKIRNQNTFSHVLSLKKITFPTGGYTEYEYEPNKFLLEGHTITGGGHRVSRILSRCETTSSPIITEFKYGVKENGVGRANLPLKFIHFGDEKMLATASNYCLAGGLCTFEFAVERSFSFHPVGSASQSMFQVSYPEVAIYQKNANNVSNGKTILLYSFDERYSPTCIDPIDYHGYPRYGDYSGFIQYGDGEILNESKLYLNWYFPLDILKYRPWKAPVLLSRRAYNSSNAVVHSEAYHYLIPDSMVFAGLKAQQKAFIEMHNSTPTNPYPLIRNPYHFVSSFYTYHRTYFIGGKRLLQEKRDTLFLDGKTHIEKETYTYNGKKQLIKTEKKTINSPTSYIEEFSYPSSESKLIEKNMLSTLIQKRSYFSRSSNLCDFVKHHYPSTSILPASTIAMGNDTVVVYNRYDNRGNLLQYTGNDNATVIYLWSYKGKYPIAEIRNSTYEAVRSAVVSVFGRSIETLSDQVFPDESKLRNGSLQNALPQAMVHTYTYHPFSGISSVTDPRKVTIYYAYDSMGRLKEVYRMNGNTKEILEYNKYNYRNF